MLLRQRTSISSIERWDGSDKIDVTQIPHGPHGFPRLQTNAVQNYQRSRIMEWSINEHRKRANVGVRTSPPGDVHTRLDDCAKELNALPVWQQYMNQAVALISLRRGKSMTTKYFSSKNNCASVICPQSSHFLGSQTAVYPNKTIVNELALQPSCLIQTSNDLDFRGILDPCSSVTVPLSQLRHRLDLKA